MIKTGAQRFAAEYGMILVAPDTSPRNTGIEGEDNDWDFGTGASFTWMPLLRRSALPDVQLCCPQVTCSDCRAFPQQPGDRASLVILWAVTGHLFVPETDRFQFQQRRGTDALPVGKAFTTAGSDKETGVPTMQAF